MDQPESSLNLTIANSSKLALMKQLPDFLLKQPCLRKWVTYKDKAFKDAIDDFDLNSSIIRVQRKIRFFESSMKYLLNAKQHAYLKRKSKKIAINPDRTFSEFNERDLRVLHELAV